MPTGGISNDQLGDLLQTTLKNYPTSGEFEVALDYQRYPACNLWFKKDKKKLDSGTSIERNILLDDSGNARHVRPYQKVPINVADTQHKITAPWCVIRGDWSISREEILRNRSKNGYISLIDSRRLDAKLSIANLLEERAWKAPSSSSDDLNPRGLPYWLSMREDGVTASTDDGGYSAYRVRYGGGTSSTTKAGIDGSAEPKWRNWAAVYTAINDDFITKMRKGCHATSFVSPMVPEELVSGIAQNFRFNLGLNALTAYEDYVHANNDNIGSDMAKWHGITTFKRIPMIYTPQLDDVTVTGGSATSNTDIEPIYGVNHQHFYPYIMEGDWMTEDGPHTDIDLPRVFTTFMYGQYQYFCNNVRQAGFVLHKTITA